ncbi:RelA/SpoT domain-containing protein [Brevundimonas diminuta]|uniref:RelA/SpoT domain-containing protein n=1 Tax=Brevundimonas diminuta TaxID=293 RepID=UPI003208F29B
MAYVSPGNYTKGALDRAGVAFRDGRAGLAELHMLENWRASHLYVINTFQSTLRSRRRRVAYGSSVIIAQRLKRRPTIIDKLSREPGMSLSRMHDIAGCRLIFAQADHLAAFRSGVLSSRAAHEIIGEQNRYDYIANPKDSGYRGIHDVYKYNVSSQSGAPWNGLRIELQYRTVIQHSWATAVEISDIVNSTRLKFSDANRDISRLFLLSSEILSRALEGVPGYCAALSVRELVEEFHHLENSVHAIARLRNLTSSQFRTFARSARLFILINYIGGPKSGQFEAERFFDNRTAANRYSELEAELQEQADVVLVGASEQDAVKLAYTNYFGDASLFIKNLDAALVRLAV